MVGLACNLTSLLSILIHPFMPDVSAEIRKQLQVLYKVVKVEQLYQLTTLIQINNIIFH